MQHRLRTLAAALTVALVPSLAGCAAEVSPRTADAARGPVRVVASTSVYGDIAATIGGRHVSVESIIDNPDRDPHEYQADGQNELSVSKAAIVIENGAGYDDFMNDLLAAAPNDDVTVLNAAAISGRNQHPAHGEFNEHLWYDLGTMRRLADRLATVLAKAEPASAGAFRSNAGSLDADLERLQGREATLKAKHAGTPVGITEPVPLYLLDAIGLDNKTPTAFSTAVEEDRDVAPTVLRSTLQLYRSHRVALLAYNPQTGGPQTEAVLSAARDARIPTVPFAEVMPRGSHYVSWMRRTIDAVAKGLER